MPSPSTVAESDCNAEYEYDGRVRLQCRVRVRWPSPTAMQSPSDEAEYQEDGRVILEWPIPSGVAESEWSFPGSLWPSPTEMAECNLAESAWPTENG